MLLHHFSLSLWPFGLKKKFLKQRDPLQPIFALPWIRPWPNLAEKEEIFCIYKL